MKPYNRNQHKLERTTRILEDLIIEESSKLPAPEEIEENLNESYLNSIDSTT